MIVNVFRYFKNQMNIIRNLTASCFLVSIRYNSLQLVHFSRFVHSPSISLYTYKCLFVIFHFYTKASILHSLIYACFFFELEVIWHLYKKNLVILISGCIVSHFVMYQRILNQSLTDRDLGCFFCFCVVNNAAINNLGCILFHTFVVISWGL